MNVTITFNANVEIYEREAHWAAHMTEPLGITVYGDTEQDVQDRIEEAFKFFFENATGGEISLLRDYLDSHNVKHSLSRGPVDSGELRQYKKTLPMSAVGA